jgi:tRNA (adenine57-N1/adenine58-N1)-methyltransferase
MSLVPLPESRITFVSFTSRSAEPPSSSFEVLVVSSALSETELDRIILDLPEPWQVISRAWTALRPGGILLCYLPTVLQVKTLVDALEDDGRFACIETTETLMRFWHIKGMSVRPQHRMVAHTGFIISARRLAQGQKDLPRSP